MEFEGVEINTKAEKDFYAVFPEVVEACVQDGIDDKESQTAYKWFKEALIYNVPPGKKNRGMAVEKCYRIMVPSASESDLHLAKVLGWALELFHVGYLLADDIMDRSLTRRGRACWYRKENVGNIAINDSMFMEACYLKVLRKYVRDKPYYMQMMEFFQKGCEVTLAGQCLDMTAAPPEGKINFSEFCMEKYLVIIKWKTAYYSLYMPVVIAMFMAGLLDEESQKNARTILLEIGSFLQIQDDYLDCYADPEVLGKIGTDIQDSKCTWLMCTALEICSKRQREELQKYYGRWEEDAVQKVKDIYRELNMESLFKAFERKKYEEIIAMTDTLKCSVPKEVFVYLIDKIHQRKK